VLTCQITAQGLLTDCTAKDETSGDYGFDKAALGLSTLFRMKPKTVDGKPVDGGTIQIPIIFQVPEGGVTSRMAFGDGAFIPTKIDPAGPRPGPPAFVMPCPDGVGECLGHTASWASRPDPQQATGILSRAGPLEEVTLALCKIDAQGRLFNCAFDGVMTLAATTAARDALLLLRMTPTTADGVPTADAVVEIPFVWEALAAGLEPKP
jgi:TonB family protein